LKKRVLLLKPFSVVRDQTDCPPLGLLYLATALRRRFGDQVEIDVRDLKIARRGLEWLRRHLDAYDPDAVGVSALNCEAAVSHSIASLVKARKPETLAVLGGPYAHNRGEEILGSSDFDWTFNGEADATFPEALDRHFHDKPLDSDIPGLSYRQPEGLHISNSQDSIKDLDGLGFPAWDLVDFDDYASKINMMTMLKGKRYAPIFTSRGCPYLCNYCHDIFGKRFIHRSAAHVLAEIELLYEHYGVDEFEIVDDIFNLHKPRLKKIMGEVKRRWPGKIHFCFPNGVRADIMDEEVVEALHQGGTYAMSVAIETVTDRLQRLIEKNLEIERVKQVIEWCDDRGIATRGFFMVGFPTETPEEVKATMDFAVQSRLTAAQFFTVTPQPATPLFDLAKQENAEALVGSERDERMGQGYRSDHSWYRRAYGHDLARMIRHGYARFYLDPRRLWRILSLVPMKSWRFGIYRVTAILLGVRDATDSLAARAGES